MKLGGGEDLGLEQLGPAAVVGEGEEGVPCVEVALNLAEVGFEGPEGEEDAASETPYSVSARVKMSLRLSDLERAVAKGGCFEISDFARSRERSCGRRPALRSAFRTFGSCRAPAKNSAALSAGVPAAMASASIACEEVAEVAATGGRAAAGVVSNRAIRARRDDGGLR